ncbi:PilZ domain-containing protein [Paenisporosarcina cavernae]|uniref:PilZ domain-containing protein n=1 Tax=Paenisporosarcina cavernae TaxID=2320858 RepID=A0A385YR47_9BACL|nr:PilZ domain-containing protein [Paenisporosarcina cavernae]AYC28964.1 PilZ domain-containing protein [Paenisporosarcina cavernae]
MEYKRQESFRHTFHEPVPALYRLVSSDGIAQEDTACVMMDMSPSGVRVYSKFDIYMVPGMEVPIEVEVVLTNQPIKMSGRVIWKRAHFDGKQYGISIDADEQEQQHIIDELKERRKIEMFQWRSR